MRHLLSGQKVLDLVDGARKRGFVSEEDNHYYEYAGFLRRSIAFLVDAIIVGLVSSVIQTFVTLPFLLADAKASSKQFKTAFENGDIQMMHELNNAAISFQMKIALIDFAIFLVIGLLYFALMESKLQSTVGKLLLSIKVVDASGKPISTKRAIARFFARFLSALPLGAGYFMAAFRKDKRTAHDMLAKTYCMNKHPKVHSFVVANTLAGKTIFPNDGRTTSSTGKS